MPIAVGLGAVLAAFLWGRWAAPTETFSWNTFVFLILLFGVLGLLGYFLIKKLL
jgi:hypothetical protein